MKILVINAGSSSCKYQLFNMDDQSVLCSGVVERIGQPMGKLSHKIAPGTDKEEKIVVERPFPTHVEGMEDVISLLLDSEKGVIQDKSEISAIGHRVLHGGEAITDPVLIDEKVKEIIRDCFPLGPLHNPANLMGIDVAEKLFPGVPNVGVFDTEFGMTLAPEAYLYPLPYSLYEELRIRRYGFHGTSHKYIAKATAAFLGKPLSELNSITMHLGNGSSMSAVQNGKCIDTSMGLTPLEGLMMGTRCGSIDPAIVPFMMEKKGMTPQEADTVLNKQSGLLGICGTSDMRDVHANIEKGDEKAALAFKMLTRSIKKVLGSYCSATLTPSCSPPVSAKTMNSSAKPSAKALSPSASRWTKRKTIPVSPGPASSAHLTAASPSSSFPPMKNWRSLRPRCASWKKARSKVFS